MHRRGRRVLLLSTIPLLLAVGACSDDSDGSGSGGATVDVADSEFVEQTGVDELDVAVPDNSFDPAYVVVSPGTKVVWTNQGRNDHNIVPVEDGSFEGVDAGDFGPGQVHSATFDDPGDYAYYCSIHGTKSLKGQAGVIRVEDDA